MPPSEPAPVAVADDPEPFEGVEVAAPVDDASPRTEIALPPAVTGTSTATGAWIPEAIPSAPDDVALVPAPEPAAGADTSEPELPASPRTLMAFPATCTGTLTSTTA